MLETIDTDQSHRHIAVTAYSRDELTTRVADTIESRKTREIAATACEELAAQSDAVSKRSRSLAVHADTTDELKAVQEDYNIPEDRVREMQDDHDLSRLHPSRRHEFISDILAERVDERVAEHDADIEAEAHEEAERHITDLFAGDAETVTLEWEQRDAGGFATRVPEEPDFVVTVPNATSDYEDIPGLSRLLSVVVLEDDTDVAIDAPYGSQTLTLDRGAYDISPKTIRDLVEDAGLIEVEQRAASCTSSDADALDIVVGRGETEKAHVIELQSSAGGYSNRFTKGWTEYRDVDLDREMVLITVGQASYYNNSLRGKSERAWLVGRDDDQIWSQQVYTSHETVDEALQFMTPAEAQRKAEEGREVIRQGDVFFVEMVRSSNFEAIDDTRHDVEETGDGVVINHPEHEDLELDGEWKALTNNDGSQSSSSTGRRVVRD